MDRRKFLRMFGVGATVVPIVGAGTGVVPMAARIIEAPKMELVESMSEFRPEFLVGPLPPVMRSGNTVTMTFDYRDPVTGRQLVSTVHGMLADCRVDTRYDYVDVTSLGAVHRGFAPMMGMGRVQDWHLSICKDPRERR